MLYPSLTWRINSTEKHLYLTFDDGPVVGPTDFVLDLLSKEEIKATFFCVGRNIERFPKLFERIVSDGHAVGNHTYDHVDGWKLSVDAYTNEIRKCSELIDPESKYERSLFRPPYGRITHPKMKRMKQFRIVMWDVLTYDFDNRVRPDECLDGALKAVRPGSVVVFHDSHKAERNMTYALPRFVEECRNRGYTFQTIDAGS